MTEKNEQEKIIHESIKITGHINIKLYGPDGVLKQEVDKPNLVVTSGKNYLAAWLAAASQPGEFMSYVGLGTGSTAPVIGNTTLQTELSGGGYSRQIGVLTSSTNIWQSVTTFGPGNGTGSLTEAGLFSVSSSGTMFARQVFSTVVKSVGDTATITWQITFN